MKRQHFSERERALVEPYLVTLKPSFAPVVRSTLHVLCQTFRQRWGDAAIFQYSSSSAWVAQWVDDAALKPATVAIHLSILRNWWQWLFLRTELPDNVLCFLCSRGLSQGREPVLHLPPGLHRHAIGFESTLGSLAPKSQQGPRLAIKDFIRFMATEPAATSLSDAITLDRLQDWLRSLRKSFALTGIIQYADYLERFLEYLLQRGQIASNPLADLRRKYPLRRRTGVVRALLEDHPADALDALVRPPRYQSSLAPRLEAFLNWKRTQGCKYLSAEIALADWDRFLRGETLPETGVTREMLDRYAASLVHVTPLTRSTRLGLVRQFCRYLQRFDPDAFVPSGEWTRVSIPRFHPTLIPPEHFATLLEAVERRFERAHWPLRKESFRAFLILLWGTGLRPGEALRLSREDADLAAGILTVRETKFYKTRLVPVAPSVLEHLRRYAGIRDERLGPLPPETSFFTTSRSQGYSLSTMEKTYRQVWTLSGLPVPPGQRPPRLHDFRHSFAVRRLTQWYRDGADVQNKLPLLSTYLGHANIAATQVYLHATVELLEEANHRFQTFSGALITYGDPHESR